MKFLVYTLSVCCLLCCGQLVFTKHSNHNSDISYKLQRNNTSRIRRQTPGCSVVHNNAEREGLVTSPGYPNGYPDNLDCQITIVSRNGGRITLQLDEIDLEPSEGCVFDHLEIYDGNSIDAPILGRLCLDSQRTTLQSTGNSLLVRFLSDEFSGGKGFRGRYIIDNQNRPPARPPTPPSPPPPSTSPQPATGCEKMLNPMEKTVSSPGFPGRYDDNLDCKIAITANNPRDRVTLVFDTIDLEVSEDCLFDYVAVYDGPNTDSPQLGQFCSDNQKTTLVSSGDTLLVHFKSDDFSSSNGFRATFSSPGGVKLPAGLQPTSTPSPIQPRPLRPWQSPNCGVPKLAQPTSHKALVLRGRIVGGNEAAIGAHPWQVMFWDRILRAFCGGSLLTDRWIITAAHCFTDNRIKQENVVVRLGKHTTGVDDETGEVTMDIDKVITHPLYDNKTKFDCDIAMVRLKVSVQFTDYILPLCLLDQEVIQKNVFESDTAWGLVAGWGRILQSGPYSKTLMEVNLPIVNQRKCEQALGQSLITDNMFCAGFFDANTGDACSGDSGGPLLAEIDTRWSLVGIVSWGIGCAREAKYGVYTKVLNFYDWIENVMTSSR